MVLCCFACARTFCPLIWGSSRNGGGGRSLYDKGIGDAGAVQLGDLLAKNTSVTTIGLRRNNIGDAGAASLGAGLAKNTSVKEINLRYNNIGDAGAAALEKSLMQNSTLTSIDLGGNPMSDASKQAVEGLAARNALRPVLSGLRDNTVKEIR